MRKKLKMGNVVRVSFIGSSRICEVIEVVDKTTYRVKEIRTGIIIPNARWKSHMDKRAVWFIEDFISDANASKSLVSIDTRKQTTVNSELNTAIKKQLDFIKGNVKK